jgi:hypothetical protein
VQGAKLNALAVLYESDRMLLSTGRRPWTMLLP